MAASRTLLFLVVALFSLASLGSAQQFAVQDDVNIVRGPEVNAKDTWAEIKWETNNRAATFVRYGTDSNNLDKESLHSGGARDHRVVLTELQPNTTYHFAILTQDGQVRQRGQFRTEGSGQAAQTGQAQTGQSIPQADQGPMADAAASVNITEGPVIRNLTANSAMLFWRTDKVAANDVFYGTDANNLDQRAFEREGTREHTAELTNLQPNQTYYFEIRTREGQARQRGSFQTLDQQTAATYPTVPTQTQQGQAAPAGQQTAAGGFQITEGPMVEYVDSNRAVITWRTNQPSQTVVRWGSNPRELDEVARAPWSREEHRLQLTGLNADTTYYFVIESVPGGDAGAQSVRSPIAAFRTLSQGEEARGTLVP